MTCRHTDDLCGVSLTVTEAAAKLANVAAVIGADDADDENTAYLIQSYAAVAADAVGGNLEDDEMPADSDLVPLDNTVKQAVHDTAAELHNAAGELECDYAAGVVQACAGLAANAVGLPLVDAESEAAPEATGATQ